MEVLQTQGVGGVRVLTLATSLGASRGSFYWHFRDRQDLLDHMLDWWDREMTDSVIQFSGQFKGDARSRIQAVAEFILRRDLNRYDAAMRSWASGDRKVLAVFRRVLKKRLEYVTHMFRESGFPPEEATARGHLLAVYLMSEGAIHSGESKKTRLRLLRCQVRVLTKPS
jgi:AcrR family transcriptional regulator